MDYVIEFDRDLTTLPIGESEDRGLLFGALRGALDNVPGATALSAGSARFTLDFSKERK
jgi:hypothetical protein